MKSLGIYNYLEDFITSIRAQGRYGFSLEEIKARYKLSDKAINQALYRLKLKKHVVPVRKGFYAVLSPEYRSQGVIPVSLFIDDLMRALQRQYYIGLLSAAALYGAAHQQPMEYFVVTEKPALRSVKNRVLKINFYVKQQWRKQDIKSIKTDAGYLQVSSPELTALDLFYYLESVSINSSYTILQELVNEIQLSSLQMTAKEYPQTTAIQRLGFLLEELQEHDLSNALFQILNDRKYFPTMLAVSKEKKGDGSNRWKVIKNINLESDL